MKREMFSVIVPTYNEKDNVRPLFEAVDKALQGIPYELIYMDDSKDETPDIIQMISDEHPNVRMVHRKKSNGLSGAVIEGFRIANGAYLAVMDADLQHPPELLRSMYLCLEDGYDLCLPSRFIPGGSDGGLNAWRKFVSWTAREMGILSLRSLQGMSDITGGYFALRKKCVENADLRGLGWKILVEVLAMGEYNRVCEIPFSFQPRNAGESKISTKVTLEYIQQLRGLRHREIKGRKVIVDRKTHEDMESRQRSGA